jgi:hypothetical protein
MYTFIYRVLILQAYQTSGELLESLIGRQCGSPQQTEGHSIGDHMISANLRHQVLQKLPAIVPCLCFTARVRCNLEQSFYLWLLCENKLIQIMQEKILP